MVIQQQQNKMPSNRKPFPQPAINFTNVRATCFLQTTCPFRVQMIRTNPGGVAYHWLQMCTHVRSEFQGKGVFFQLCPLTLNVREI